MVADVVADMEMNMVADMEVDKVADMVADMAATPKKIGWYLLRQFYNFDQISQFRPNLTI